MTHIPEALTTCPVTRHYTTSPVVNSTYLDQTIQDCMISPVIGSGHGFLHIVCDIFGINEAIGFYADGVSNDPEEKQQQFQAQVLPEEKYPNWFITLRTYLGYLGVSMAYGSSAGGSSVMSSSCCPRTKAKSIGQNLWHYGSRVYSTQLVSGSSFNSYDYYHMGTFKTLGAIQNDRASLFLCNMKFALCKSAQLPSTPNQIFKVMNYIDKVRREIKKAKVENNIADSNYPKGIYNLARRNCINFVMEAMEESGHKNWTPKLEENQESHFLQRITSFAWHYLSYLEWK